MRYFSMSVATAALVAGMAVPPAVAASASPADIQEGHRLFQQSCSVCHSPTAHEETPAMAEAPTLSKEGIEGRDKDILDAIKNGREKKMPGFKYALKDEQIGKIVAYLNTVSASAGPVERKPLPAKPISHEGKLLLSGTVKSARGEPMEGVSVAARIEGQSITVAVFTDKDGQYYFPPMAGATYRVSAQAVGFDAGRADVKVTKAVNRQDFTMKETADFIPQLTGAEFMEALPLDTPNRRRMRDIFGHACTTCHPISLAMRHRFDANGWEAIVNLMAHQSGDGVLRKTADPWIEHFKAELVAYLTEMRGPGPSPMKFKVPARPTGAATLPVQYLYQHTLEEFGGFALDDGMDWSKGTPSISGGARGSHDTSIDFDGNLWTTYFPASKNRTYARIDTRTGELTEFKLNARIGKGVAVGEESLGAAGGKSSAVTSHGIMRTPEGNMYINLTGYSAPASLGLIHTKTGEIEIFTPPKDMYGVGGHVDWDGKGYAWAAANAGAVRFDPRTGEWMGFKSPTGPREGGATYGVAGLRDGGAFWAQIGLNTVSYTDAAGSAPKALKLPETSYISENDLTAEDKAFYASTLAGVQTGPAGHQGPRRIQADKNGEDVWAGTLIGGNTLYHVNSRTLEQKFYKLPEGAYGAYMPVIDKDHNVWVGMQGSANVGKFNPKTQEWTLIPWATRGAATRHLSHYDRPDGVTEIVAALWGTPTSGRMIIRRQSDVDALKAQVAAGK